MAKRFTVREEGGAQQSYGYLIPEILEDDFPVGFYGEADELPDGIQAELESLGQSDDAPAFLFQSSESLIFTVEETP